MARKEIDKNRLKEMIREAFADVIYPGDWCLRGSDEGDDPYLLEQEFKGKTDWRTLDASFLDRAPGGQASALCFFSDEAFRFYLPAYLIADIEGQLESTDPASILASGLDDDGWVRKTNPRRYGERTAADYSRYRFSVFNDAQIAAIIAYLEFKREMDDFLGDIIDQALANYWRRRAAGEKV